MKRFFAIFLLSTLTFGAAAALAAPMQTTKPSKRAVHHKAHRAGRHGKPRHRHQTSA